MKLKPDDLLDKYDSSYKKRDEYIINVLNKEIDKVKEKQLFLELPIYFDLTNGDKSLIFDKSLLLGHFDFELSEVIFKTLENNGYGLEFKKLNNFVSCYQTGTIKILWDKYYVKWENSFNKISPLCYYLLDPISVRSFYKNYDAIAERFISEFIEPKN